MSNDYLSLREAQRKAKRKTGTIRRLAEAGALPGAVYMEQVDRWAIPEAALAHVVPYPGKAVKIAGVVYYPMKEFAARKGVTRAAVHLWIQTGRVKGRKLDGRWFISEEYL